ncbi:MAG: hypothetical protein R2754_00790 [Microthrixaceae bacterium]
MSVTPSGGRRVMAVDIGTNTVNTALSTEHGRPVHRTYYTRLGEGLDRTGKLSEAAMGRALAVLEEVAADAASSGAVEVVAAATAASREAANGGEFLARAGRTLGVVPAVIDGDEEARLTYRGALGALAGPEAAPASGHNALVVDIGGGSTELAVGSVGVNGPSLLASRSLAMGSVRYTERYLASDPPLPEELLDCLSVAEATLDEALVAEHLLGQADRLIVVAGTAETIGAVELGLAEWDENVLNGLVLSKAQVEDVFRTLATEAEADRRHNPGLPPERVPYIVAGCCVLVTIMRRMGFAECTVSVGSVRDGLLARTLDG